MSLLGVVLAGLQGLLGLAMVAAGGTKLVGAEMQVETFERFGYPQWFRVLIGSIEVVGALCLLVAFVTNSQLALVGGILVAIVLLGAIGTHVRAGDSVDDVALPVLLFVTALVVSLEQAGLLRSMG